jgi:tetratricopeptide (TPR) repeat protein
MVGTKSTNLSKWDEKLKASADEEYESFRNVLDWTEGFGLVFVQYSTVQGGKLIEKIKKDLLNKQTEVLRFQEGEEIRNLYSLVEQLPNREQIDILFIQGLEYSFFPYINSGYGGQGDYYKLDTLPPILGHLNLQRERFRKDFEICFVFLLPLFGIKYFIQRAPDFFDWRSGIFIFPDNIPDEYKPRINSFLIFSEISSTIVISSRSTVLFFLIFILVIFTPWRWELVFLFSPLLFMLIGLILSGVKKAIYVQKKHNKKLKKINFVTLVLRGIYATQWGIRGYIFLKLDKNKESSYCFEQAIKDYPDYYQAWDNRGNALSKQEKYEEAIACYNQALKIKGNYYQAFRNRAYSLYCLGNYEDAIESYDKALEIKSDDHKSWNNRGIILEELGILEEAIKSYNQALKFYDDHEYWNNKGIILRKLGEYEEAIKSYNSALRIKPNYYKALFNKAFCLRKIGENNRDESEKRKFYEQSLEVYKKILKIEPKRVDALNNKGNLLYLLGDYDGSLKIYDKSIKSIQVLSKELKPYEKGKPYYNKSCVLAQMEKIEDSLICLKEAINLDSKYILKAKNDADFDKIRHDRRFIDLINQSDSP